MSYFVSYANVSKRRDAPGRVLARLSVGALACILLSHGAIAVERHSVTSAVYRCRTADVTVFSDRPCDAQARLYSADTSRVSSYTPSEPAAIAKSGTSSKRPPGKAKARSSPSTAAQQARQAAQCERIHSSLREIKAKMRSGYDAREGERLRERQAKLEDRRRADRCR